MRGKIFMAFLTVITVLFISEAFFFAMHFVVVRKYQQITDNLVSEYHLIETTSEMVDSFYYLIQYANDQQRMDIFYNNLIKLQSLLANLDESITDSESWTVYLGVKSTINGVVEDAKSGVAAILAGNFSEVTPYYLEASKKNGFVKDNTANLILKELGYVEEIHSEIIKIRWLSEIIALALFFVIVLSCLLYAFYVSHKLSINNVSMESANGGISSPDPKKGKNIIR